MWASDFSKIKRWLNDLNANCEIMMKLINSSDDGLNISYSTIGTALICSEPDIPFNCAELLNKINLNTRMNWDWLKNEGLDLMLFTIIKAENDREKLSFINRLIINIPDGYNIEINDYLFLKGVPNIQNIQYVDSQIRLLTEARDRLLPKLMNGEIELEGGKRPERPTIS